MVNERIIGLKISPYGDNEHHHEPGTEDTQ